MLTIIKKIFVVISSLWLLMNTCAHYTTNTGSIHALTSAPHTDAVKSVTALLKRLLPGYTEHFIFEIIPKEN